MAKISKYLCIALAGLSLSAWNIEAQDLLSIPTEGASAQTEDSLETTRVVVTGSNIPRSAEEVSATPVITIDRQDIEDSGRATIGDVLQRLPINSGGAVNETFADSLSRGVSALSLRGLGVSNTLTLIDGRRVAPYAVPIGTDPATDLNSLPLGAIQRVEILKDGASAIYGADAVAGVVNIILRDDYQGLELGSRYGNTTRSDAGELLEQLVGGVTSKKGSLLFTGDFYKRNEQRLADRSYSQRADSAHNPPDLTTADPNYHQFTYPGKADGGTFPPGTPYGLDNRSSRPFPGQFVLPDGSTVSPIPGTSGQSLSDYRAGYVPYNFNSFVTDHPDVDRYGFFGKGKYELFPPLTVYTELLYNRSDSRYQRAPSNFESDSLQQLLISADNPYNPSGIPIGYGAGNGTDFRYRALDFGPRIYHDSTDFYRGVLGSTVKLPLDLSFDSSALYSQSHVHELGQNNISVPALRATLLSNDPATAYNVFSGIVGANSQQIINRLKVDSTRDSTSELWLFDGKLNGPVPYLKLPAGPVMFAAGGEYRHERLNDRSDALSNAFLIAAAGGLDTFGERDVYAGYYEVDVPVFSPAWNLPGVYAFDLTVAQRYEHYNEIGGYSAPKFTARAQPCRDLTLRGSYSEGVRAPSLAELSGESIDTATLADPLGLGGGPDYNVRTKGNPGLLPEKSYALYGGFVYSPSFAFLKGLSVSLDWSQIIRRRSVGTFPVYLLLQKYGLDPAGNDIVVRNPNGSIDYVNVLFENLGAVKVRDFDFDVNYSYDTGRFGKVAFDATGTYLQSYKVISGLGDPNPGVAGYNNKVVSYGGSDLFGSSQPLFKAQGSLFWRYKFGARTSSGAVGDAKDDRGKGSVVAPESPVDYTQAFNLGVTLNYVGSYQEGVGNFDRTGGLPQFNITAGYATLRTVQSFTTVDLIASYTYKNTTLTVGINNVGDEKPPFLYGYDQGFFTNYDSTQANSLGRVVYGELKFKF